MIMETTGRYATSIEGDKQAAIARIAIYARLSRDSGGLSVNTSIQVAECLEEARRYVQDRLLRARIVVIFEENDVSASAYSKKKRPDFQRLIELGQRAGIQDRRGQDVVPRNHQEQPAPSSVCWHPRASREAVPGSMACDLRPRHLGADAAEDDAQR